MKHKMKTLFLVLLSALLCGVILLAAACGRDQPEDPTDTQPASGPATEAPTDPAAEPATDPETEPADDTQPATEPETTPETDAPTEPVTETPATEPETLPETRPETQPVTEEDTILPVDPSLLALDPVDGVTLPASSDTLSPVLANELLTLCSGGGQAGAQMYFAAAGFEIVLEKNYDKSPDDPAHNCGYTIGKKTMEWNGETRTVLLIAVRGTSGAEWYSNFDFAPSQDPDTLYAENFRMCAANVYEGAKPLIAAEEHPVVLVCGHSRGASTANLLGGMLNADMDPADVFVYTFATPTTVRGEMADVYQGNIFNFINPLDIVTELPLKVWNYGHLGTDIILPVMPGQDRQSLDAALAIMNALAPTIPSYYQDKHSLTAAGLAEDGMTTKDFMDIICKMLISSSGGEMAVDFRLFMIQDASDFKPFVNLLTGMVMSPDGTQGIFMNHMPITYQALMAAWAQMQ